MKTPAYRFTALDGTVKEFADYITFATWYFTIARRVMQAAFAPDEFRRINNAATRSAAARKAWSERPSPPA